MRRQYLIGLCGVLIASTLGCSKAAGRSDEAAAVAAIVKLGGKVEYYENKPDSPVRKVYLHATGVKDADLALLKKLPKLQSLFLAKTQISDAGLEHLKNSGELHTLSLNSTSITDAGLKTIAGIKSLKTVNLQETKVTESGIQELRQILSDLKVSH